MTQSDIINKAIAADTGLKKDLVEAITRSQFEFVTTVMEAGNIDDEESFKSVRLQYLGVWYVHPWRKKKLIEKALKRRAEQSDQPI